MKCSLKVLVGLQAVYELSVGLCMAMVEERFIFSLQQRSVNPGSLGQVWDFPLAIAQAP